jgi:hypothetical protein
MERDVEDGRNGRNGKVPFRRHVPEAKEYLEREFVKLAKDGTMSSKTPFFAHQDEQSIFQSKKQVGGVMDSETGHNTSRQGVCDTDTSQPANTIHQYGIP